MVLTLKQEGDSYKKQIIESQWGDLLQVFDSHHSSFTSEISYDIYTFSMVLWILSGYLSKEINRLFNYTFRAGV